MNRTPFCNALVVVVCALILNSCVFSSHDRKLSFCYWNNPWNQDSSLFRQFKPAHFYVRYFDVDWDTEKAMPRPISSITFNDTMPCLFTPSVYITNNVLLYSNQKALDSLAVRICRKIKHINTLLSEELIYHRPDRRIDDRDSILALAETQLNEKTKDVLIDCDWTKATKTNYFYLLKKIKEHLGGKSLEVTLRLWQYRYPKLAGIPPADRCLLMCYNMDPANDYQTINSIASLATLKKYIQHEQRYPVPLNLALPLFKWAILFRHEKAVGIIGNDISDEYSRNKMEFKQIKPNTYVLLTEKVMGRFFARPGDVIRIEQVDMNLLTQMSTMLSQELALSADARITFFAWNSTNLQNYSSNDFEKIYNCFR